MAIELDLPETDAALLALAEDLPPLAPLTLDPEVEEEPDTDEPAVLVDFPLLFLLLLLLLFPDLIFEALLDCEVEAGVSLLDFVESFPPLLLFEPPFDDAPETDGLDASDVELAATEELPLMDDFACELWLFAFAEKFFPIKR